jgi:hypothetical protein
VRQHLSSLELSKLSEYLEHKTTERRVKTLSTIPLVDHSHFWIADYDMLSY